jgi:hypothetical protein
LCPQIYVALADFITDTKGPSGPSLGLTPNTAISSHPPPTTAKSSSGAKQTANGPESLILLYTLQASTLYPGPLMSLG